MSGDMNNKPEENSQADPRWSNDYLTCPSGSTYANHLDSSISLDDFVLADDPSTTNRISASNAPNKLRETCSEESMGNSKSKAQRKVSFNQVVEHSDSSCSLLDQDSDAEIQALPDNLADAESSLSQSEQAPVVSEKSQDEPSVSFKTALESLSSEQHQESAHKLSEASIAASTNQNYNDRFDEEQKLNEEQEVDQTGEIVEENLDDGQTEMDTMMNCLPDKPPTAFQIFVNDFKTKYSERFSHLTAQEIFDLCSEIWIEMSAVRKTEFQSTSARLQSEYAEKLKLYHAQRKKPRTAYQIFMSDFLARENERRNKMKRASRLSKLDLYQRGIRKWRRLRKSEKADFQEQSRLSQLYAKRTSTYASVSEPIMSRRKY